jgi:superfamily II DNA or RNA helicase
MEYEKFIESKALVDIPTGIDPPELIDSLYGFQRDIVSWALRRGRACIFADCGMGKTIMQLEWARCVSDHGGNVLIVAPLAVAHQTVSEGGKFGINVEYRRDGVASPITITNYEMLEHFNPSDFVGVVLDESSILKSYTGKFRNMIIQRFINVPFRLACTATPAPNDFMELGNHAEFTGAMTGSEMLSAFFINDPANVGRYKLKGHADAGPFWDWMAGWSVMIRQPSDLGYGNGKFTLPEMNLHHHTVTADNSDCSTLFAMAAYTMQERLQARRDTIKKRTEAVAKMANNDETWIVWCNLNSEAELATELIDGAVNVTGSMSIDAKSDAMMAFSRGEIRVLVTKPKIAGFGMNWQHCSNVAFLGLNDSWESYYQAVRRCWRFGQERTVNVHIVTADIEGEVVSNISRKDAAAEEMHRSMIDHTKYISAGAIRKDRQFTRKYTNDTTIEVPVWL